MNVIGSAIVRSGVWLKPHAVVVSALGSIEPDGNTGNAIAPRGSLCIAGQSVLRLFQNRGTKRAPRWVNITEAP